jgi:hypothetical protein
MQRCAKYELVDYASRYWADHLRHSKFLEAPDKLTIQLLDWFIHPYRHGWKYVSWQQMYHRNAIYFCPNRPPLYYAIEFKIESLISLLFPLEEDLDKLHCSLSPLHVASRCGALKTTLDLLCRGASVDLKDGYDDHGATALHYAAEGGHANVIQLLLTSGASPHAKTESGATPFFRAVRSGSIQALKALYDAESDIDAQKDPGFTPLLEAVSRSLPRMVCQLLEWGADPTIENHNGESALTLLKWAHDGEVHRARRRITEQFEKENGSWSCNHGKGHDPGIANSLITEEDIYQQIQDIRAQKTGGKGFMNLLRGLKRRYVLIKELARDTRPGTEREKDYRWAKDVKIYPKF